MNRSPDFPYLPKDFIETEEGLIFAVVSYGPQAGKVGCFLRYVRSGSGWQKVATEEANTLLAENYPQYLYHSQQFDAAFHAVSIECIVQHHRPEQVLIDLISIEACDQIMRRLQRLIIILVRYGAGIHELGVTGSLLIGAQKSESDIDLVVYGRDEFHKIRSGLKQAVTEGALSLLDDALMRDNFRRRLGELSYDDFSWHENRKFNKAVIDGTKFDIGMVDFQLKEDENKQYKKQGVLTLVTRVIDDQFSFDFPARYSLNHDEISEVVVYTQTYVGQAKVGEKIEVSGAIECDVVTGQCRLIVGSSREAVGEYIKVINK
ncbi:MAG: hypothetical protein HN475_08045 [Piscirickettsiaceae bacterium]|jgi:predicted nucleotidyltransferase|nr:hypothetical protein [Piscirickettsiaceae bacterium]